MRFVPSKEAREYFHCSVPALYQWKKQGLIRYKKFGKGKYLYDIDSFDESNAEAGGTNDDKQSVIYARVSCIKQKGDLDTQIETIKQYCISKGVKISKVYKDVASGMNENRGDFNSMIAEIIRGNIKTVYISFKDRLTRFGFNYFKYIFSLYDTEIIVLDEAEETNKTFQQELTDDLIAIIHHFSMKLYSNRRKKLKSIEKIISSPDEESADA